MPILKKIESESTQENTSKNPLSIIIYQNPSRDYSTFTITPSEVTVDVRPVSWFSSVKVPTNLTI